MNSYPNISVDTTTGHIMLNFLEWSPYAHGPNPKAFDLTEHVEQIVRRVLKEDNNQ